MLQKHLFAFVIASMKIDRFQIRIEEGDLAFNTDQHKKLWHSFLRQFEGKKVNVEVTENKSTRSQQQHNYYFFYLGVIEDETGNKRADLHELFKGKFLSSGIVEIFGEKVRRKSSTKTLSVGRFVEYLMEIEEFTGVPLPDTQAYYGYSYHKH